MELDLTRLNSLAFTDFKREQEKKQAPEAPESPAETQTASGEYKTLTEPKKPLETLTEGLEGIHKLQRQADAKKQDIDRSLAICREYQQNIKTSSQLQTEILKGVRAGEDIYSLFLKAVKAISLMTSNTVFYSQLEGDIRAIYGRGLLDPLPLQIELQQVQERLKRLREAEEREPQRPQQDRKEAEEANGMGNSEDRLLTIAEIAQELKLPESTVRSPALCGCRLAGEGTKRQ